MLDNVTTEKTEKSSPDKGIVPCGAEKSPDDVLVASGGGFNKASTLVNGADGLGGSPGATIAGGLIGVAGQGIAGLPAPCSYVQYSDLQGTLETVPTITATFMVDGKKLQGLLRPKHKYFEDKWGSVASFSCYEDEDEGKRLLYPKVKVQHRENPYRKMQIRRQTTGRTTRAMFQLIGNNHLKDFRAADVTFTMPREVSVYLASKAHRGREFAWRMENRLWLELEAVGLYSSGLARSVNLHPWKTENPLQPHFHFHEMVPNYELTVVEGLNDEGGDEVFQFGKRAWDTGSMGSGGPWTKDELRTVKAVWTLVVKRFVRKHGVKCPLFDDAEATLDVHVDFIRLDTEMGRVRFMHKLNYKARHWSEDYAKYSNENLDCENPPPWLMHYDNRTRVFGWWGNLKVMAGRAAEEEKEKLSPYTGKKLTPVAVGMSAYKGDEGLESLLEYAGGRLFWVEFIRGRPVEGEYNAKDLAWLKCCCLTRDEYGTNWHHNYPESMDLQGTLSFEGVN